MVRVLLRHGLSVVAGIAGAGRGMTCLMTRLADVPAFLWTMLMVASGIALTSAPLWRAAYEKWFLIVLVVTVVLSFFLSVSLGLGKHIELRQSKTPKQWFGFYVQLFVMSGVALFVFSTVYGFESFGGDGLKTLAWLQGDRTLGAYFEALITYIYFSLVTMSTLGYGEIVPVSVWAKLAVIFIQLSGLAIVVYGISDALDRARRDRN